MQQTQLGRLCNQLTGLHQSRSHQNNIGPCRNPWRTIEHVRGAVIIATTGLWDPGGNGLKLKFGASSGAALLLDLTLVALQLTSTQRHPAAAAHTRTSRKNWAWSALAWVASMNRAIAWSSTSILPGCAAKQRQGMEGCRQGGGGGTGGEEKLVGGRARCDLVMMPPQAIIPTARRAKEGAWGPRGQSADAVLHLATLQPPTHLRSAIRSSWARRWSA